MLECAECGDEVTIESNRIATAAWCSDQCYQRHTASERRADNQRSLFMDPD
jgi:endogenous inhibitor of DNA gyrase (YacG/DUF329 family)